MFLLKNKQIISYRISLKIFGRLILDAAICECYKCDLYRLAKELVKIAKTVQL